MRRAGIDLSDVLPRYAEELDAFRAAARSAARDVFCEHLFARLSETPLAALRASVPEFGKRLLDHLVDVGDVLVGDDGRARPSDELSCPRPAAEDVIARYAAGSDRRASTAYFLEGCRAVAGGVLAGEDGLKLLRARDPGGVMARWESVMLGAPVLEPCRAFAARALASRLTRPLTVLEGGAGVGVVLRTLLADPALAPRAASIEAYHYTDLDPALLAVGKARIGQAAPALQRAMVYRRLDLDALARDPSASGLAPASVDAIVLEHVLYDVEDLHGTLVALRRLLRADGALIFTCGFRGRPGAFFPCEMLQLTLASYRRAKLDPPYRTTLGYLTAAEWERSLSRAGFDLALEPALEDLERMPHGGIVAHARGWAT